MRQGLHKRGFWDHGGTLNEINSPGEAPERDIIAGKNWPVDEDGVSRTKRAGYIKFDSVYNFGSQIIKGIFDFKDDNNQKRTVVCTETSIWVSEPSGAWTEAYSQANKITVPIKPIVFNSGRPIIIGYNQNLYIDGNTTYNLGIDAPLTAVTLADSGVAGNPNGDYICVVTYYRSGDYPCESNPSPESNTVTVASKKISVSAIPVSSDPQVDKKRLYFTTAGGAIFHWAVDIPNADTTYTYNFADSSIVENDEVSYERYPPSLASWAEVWDDKVWLNRRYENIVEWTNTGTAEERALDNWQPVKAKESDDLTTMKAFGDMLFVFKNKSSVKFEKTGISAYEMTPLPQNVGCEAPASIAVDGNIMIWKSKRGIELFNGYSFARPILSKVIKRTIASINEAYISKAFGEIYEKIGKYLISVPTGDSTEPNTVIVWDYMKNSFDIYEFAHKMTAFYNTKDGDENLIFLSGSYDGEFFIQGEGPTDDGTEIEASFRKAWIPISGERDVWNALRRLFVKYSTPLNKTITMKIYSNFQEEPMATFYLDGMDLATDSDIRHEIVKEIICAIRGTHISFEFINNDVIDGDCRVIGFDGYFRRNAWKRTVTGQ